MWWPEREWLAADQAAPAGHRIEGAAAAAVLWLSVDYVGAVGGEERQSDDSAAELQRRIGSQQRPGREAITIDAADEGLAGDQAVQRPAEVPAGEANAHKELSALAHADPRQRADAAVRNVDDAHLSRPAEADDLRELVCAQVKLEDAPTAWCPRAPPLAAAQTDASAGR